MGNLWGGLQRANLRDGGDCAELARGRAGIGCPKHERLDHLASSGRPDSATLLAILFERVFQGHLIEWYWLPSLVYDFGLRRSVRILEDSRVAV